VCQGVKRSILFPSGPGLDDSLPTTASKRFLDLLVHLARYKTRVAQELVPLPIPLPTVVVNFSFC
jgi:hypothetical protein